MNESLISDQVAEVLQVGTLVLSKKFMIGVIAGFRVPARTLLFDEHGESLQLRYSERGSISVRHGAYL
jgi:hypothetical protein